MDDNEYLVCTDCDGSGKVAAIPPDVEPRDCHCVLDGEVECEPDELPTIDTLQTQDKEHNEQV